MNLDKLIWRYLIRPLQRMHRAMYARGMTERLGRFVLLLTTRGRRSGLKRVTPLQFSEIHGDYYVASSRGCRADWFRNIQADPHVEVEVDRLHLEALAEPVTEPAVIADYLQWVIASHPRMGGAMMRLHHLPSRPSRQQLEKLSAELALVVLHPHSFSGN